MTIIFEDWFETNDFTAWGGILGSPEITSEQAYNGLYSMKCTAIDQCAYKVFGSNYNIAYVGQHIRFTTDPSDGDSITIAEFRNSGWSVIARLVYEYTSGVRKLTYLVEADYSSYTITLETNRWYNVVIGFDNVTDIHRVYLDGVNIFNVNEPTSSTVNMFFAGTYDSTGTLDGTFYFDRVIVSDAYIGVSYSPKTRSSLPNTMVTMLNSKMLFG